MTGDEKEKERIMFGKGKKLWAVLLAFVLMICSSFSAMAVGPGEGIAAGGELRGVWISYLDWNALPKEENAFRNAVDSMMDNCVSKGLNAVFVHVRSDGDAMYPSEYFPWSKFASGKQGQDPGYDPLAYFISSAHKRGLKFHAWINPYRITGYLNRYSDLSADNPAIAWRNDGDTSNDRCVLLHEGEFYYNPAVPAVRERIVSGVEEVVEKYDVDGIHFDDYFYPAVDDGNPEKWFDKPEYEHSGSSLPIAEWRRNNVNLLIKDVYRAIKSRKPDVSFGISPEGYLTHLRLDTRLFADVDTWVHEKGYLDYIMPQIYWGFEAKTAGGSPAPYAFETCLNDWLELTKDSHVTLYTGLALYKAGTDAKDNNETPEWLRRNDIMKRQILAGRKNGCVNGFCFYDYSSLDRETAKEEVKYVTELFR